MKPQIATPPRTMMELYRSLPEGTLAELIDNHIFMSPSPAFNHQEVLMEMASQVRTYLKMHDGKLAIAPFDVFLDETTNAVQPDIVVILKGNPGKLFQKGHFHGVPDIAVEILSPNNKDHDLIRKRELYERFGVKEYWIVDPENKLTIVYGLEGKEYQVASEARGSIASKLLGKAFSF